MCPVLVVLLTCVRWACVCGQTFACRQEEGEVHGVRRAEVTKAGGKHSNPLYRVVLHTATGEFYVTEAATNMGTFPLRVSGCLSAPVLLLLLLLLLPLLLLLLLLLLGFLMRASCTQ